MERDRQLAEQQRRLPIAELWVKSQYLRMYLEGSKTIDVRLGTSNFRALQPGRRVVINRDDRLRMEVTRNTLHRTLENLIAQEDISRIDPYRTAEGLLQDGRTFFSEEGIARHGLVAIEMVRKTGKT